MPFISKKISDGNIPDIVRFFHENEISKIDQIKIGSSKKGSLFHQICEYINVTCNESNRKILTCIIIRSNDFKKLFKKNVNDKSYNVCQNNIGKQHNINNLGDNLDVNTHIFAHIENFDKDNNVSTSDSPRELHMTDKNDE